MLQELNNRLAAEITKMRSMVSEDGVGDSGTTIQGKELYELEVSGRAEQCSAVGSCFQHSLEKLFEFSSLSMQPLSRYSTPQ